LPLTSDTLLYGEGKKKDMQWPLTLYYLALHDSVSTLDCSR